MFGRFRIFGAATLWLFWSSSGLAQPTYTVEQMYKDTEREARAMYAQSYDLMEKERKRKAEAGEPPSSPADLPIVDRGVKELVYNKAVITALCGEQAIRQSKNFDEVSLFLKTCSDEKSKYIVKFYKMSDYAGAIDRRKSARCEMKARDYANEIRLPPFDFLRTTDGPPLFDYKILTDCLLSDRD